MSVASKTTDAHTPGPWRWDDKKFTDGRTRRRTLSGPKRATVLQGCHGGICFLASKDADARLIAAAPDMLETLRGINRVLSPGNRTLDEMMRDVGHAVDRARGAIEKATAAVAGAQEER